MGIDVTTYVAYGVHVPSDRYQGSAWNQTDLIDEARKSIETPPHVSLGHLTAGSYERDELFLCCSRPYDRDDPLTHADVELGTHRVYPASWFSSVERREWDHYLKLLIDELGYGDLGEPGWIVVPDES